MVIGGSGRTGGHIVRRLRARGDRVRVLSRRPGAGDDGVEVVAGSAADAGAIDEAVAGVDAVVVVVESAAREDGTDRAPSLVHEQGMRTVVEALGGRPVPVVLISQIYLTRPEAYPEVRDTIAARARAEELLRGSGLPYVVVRPSWLTDDAGGQSALRLEQGDRGEGQVSRADVAEVVVQALAHLDAAGSRTFEVYAEPGDPPSDWAATFAALAADPTTRDRS